MNDRKEQESGYAIVENVIVMPIVFVILFALLFAGFMLHAQCTIDSAAKRGVLYAAKMICDPQYETITAAAIDGTKGELNELAVADYNFASIEHYEPYRYLPFLSSSGLNNVESKTSAYVQNIIDQTSTWMFTIDAGGINCEANNYFLVQSIKVTVSADYHTPKLFQMLGVEETYQLTSEAVMTVSDQDEFIRNVDFVVDMVSEVLESLGIKDQIVEPLNKLKNFLTKVFAKK